jgi:transglutaminase-like putative cysteine protease
VNSRVMIVLTVSLFSLATIGGLAASDALAPIEVGATESMLTPQAYLPLLANRFPFPLPTPFVTPSAMRRYKIDYSFESDQPQVWMPVPRRWDGNGVSDVSAVQISPPPSDRYQESNGVEIAYWDNPARTRQTFKVSCEAEISLIEYGVSETRPWPPYDTQSDLYRKNTASSPWVQVDDPEIMNQAAAIVGTEQNPYRKAKLIHQWVRGHISGPLTNQDPEDALSVLHNRYGGCGGHSNLFVGLCRASGIPARNVAGIHNPDGLYLESGSWAEGTLHTHVWAEVFLPGYGWIQDEPTNDNTFGRILDPRLVTSKGNDIVLGHGNSCQDHNDPYGVLSWFHIPYAPCQNAYQLTLAVVPVP